MIEVPDAPYIRDAEINGMPDPGHVYCPVCGEEDPEEFFIADGYEVIGCSECIDCVDPFDWRDKHPDYGLGVNPYGGDDE